MTTEREYPKCAICNQPMKHFADWFTEKCPSSLELEPLLGGHQLTTEEWMSLPYGPKEAQEHETSLSKPAQ